MTLDTLARPAHAQQVGLATAAALLAFGLSSGTVLPAALSVAVLLAVGGAALSLIRPHAASLVAIALIALVPVYYGRSFLGARLAITPVIAVSVVLLPTALRHVRRLQLRAIDAAVIAFVVLRVLAYLINYSNGLGAAAALVLQVALPYAVFRVVSLVPGIENWLARGLVVVGAALAIAAIVEHRTGVNPFHTFIAPQYQAWQWARPEMRFSSVRAEASFGHPIALGMFLALAMVLAFALAFSAKRAVTKVLFYASVGVMAQALVDTLSRGPLIAGACALAVWLLLQVRRLSPGRALAIVALGFAFVSIGSSLSSIYELRQSSTGNTREARSAEFRLELIRLVRDERQFSWLGQETSDVGGVTASVSHRVGLRSVDNEFALIFISTGALPLLMFVGVGLLLWREALARGLTSVQRAWAVGTAVPFLNLFTVALPTQHADLFWVSVAVIASIGQQRAYAARTLVAKPSIAAA